MPPLSVPPGVVPVVAHPQVSLEFFKKNFKICFQVSRETRCGGEIRTVRQMLRTVLAPKGQKRLAAGSCFPLDAQRLWVLGSDAQDSDIVIDAAFIDRRHAKLVFAGIVAGRACWEICDFGSDNGTFLNGVRVTRARLERYAQFRVCEHALSESEIADRWVLTLANSNDCIAFGLGRNVREGGCIPDVAIRVSFRFQESQPQQPQQVRVSNFSRSLCDCFNICFADHLQ